MTTIVNIPSFDPADLVEGDKFDIPEIMEDQEYWSSSDSESDTSSVATIEEGPCRLATIQEEEEAEQEVPVDMKYRSESHSIDYGHQLPLTADVDDKVIISEEGSPQGIDSDKPDDDSDKSENRQLESTTPSTLLRESTQQKDTAK